MQIFTIGHSILNINQFISELSIANVRQLVDVRSYPGSRYMPQFNKENMPAWLAQHNINYLHMPNLGGRRRQNKLVDPALVEGWQNISFKNYAAYTLTEQFEQALNQLIEAAQNQTTCIMCAESQVWRCHRVIISNSLVLKGVEVYHIMSNKLIKHSIGKYGANATILNGKVVYLKQ